MGLESRAPRARRGSPGRAPRASATRGPGRARSRSTGVGPRASTRGVNSRARSRSARRGGKGPGRVQPSEHRPAPLNSEQAVSSRGAARAAWRPARASRPEGTRAGGRGRARPTSAAPAGSSASETPPGPWATWRVGHEDEGRGRVLDHALQAEPRGRRAGGGRSWPGRPRGPGRPPRRAPSRASVATAAAASASSVRAAPRRVAAQPEKAREVDAGGGGRGGIEAIGGVHPRREGAGARRPRDEREERAPVRPEDAGPWISETCPAREAAAEERVHRGDPRRQRAQPPVLAAQRRRVGLQPAGAEQVFEGALPLGQGRCERGGGERDGTHDFRFFFAINDRSWAGARQSQNLGVARRRPPPLDSVRGRARGVSPQDTIGVRKGQGPFSRIHREYSPCFESFGDQTTVDLFNERSTQRRTPLPIDLWPVARRKLKWLDVAQRPRGPAQPARQSPGGAQRQPTGTAQHPGQRPVPRDVPMGREPCLRSPLRGLSLVTRRGSGRRCTPARCCSRSSWPLGLDAGRGRAPAGDLRQSPERDRPRQARHHRRHGACGSARRASRRRRSSGCTCRRTGTARSDAAPRRPRLWRREMSGRRAAPRSTAGATVPTPGEALRGRNGSGGLGRLERPRADASALG